MAWTQTDVDTLKSAIAGAVMTVSYNGPPARTITYQNLTEMRSLLAEMIAQVEGAAGRRHRYRLAAFRKGV